MVTGRDDSHHHIGGLTREYGVVGVALDGRDAARPLYYSLYALQHRGQESTGAVTHDGFQQHNHVQMGLVGDAFGADGLDNLRNEAGIGRVRYPTTGDVSKSCTQPFTVSLRSRSLGLTHNGNLVDAGELRDKLKNFDHAFTSTGDTEVVAHDLARDLPEEGLVRAVKRTMGRIHGSHALTIMHDETVLGVHDPEGSQLLCIGKVDDGYALASESTIISALDDRLVRDVKPDGLVVLEPDGSGFDSYQLIGHGNTTHCFFEHIYFARPDPVMNGTLVYEARWGLGRELWDENGVDTDVIIPVPGSDRALASGYAEAAQEDDATAELAEGLAKNRYVSRTLIMPTQGERKRAVHLKLDPIKSIVEGKSVTLIDSSIVRGTTPNQLVQLLYDAGVTKIHMRIGAPPIVALYYMGINMATREELVTPNKSVEEIRDTIGTDSLSYLSTDSVTRVLEESQSDLYLGYITGKYPHDIGDEEANRDVNRPVVGAEAPLSD